MNYFVIIFCLISTAALAEIEMLQLKANESSCDIKTHGSNERTLEEISGKNYVKWKGQEGPTVIGLPSLVCSVTVSDKVFSKEYEYCWLSGFSNISHELRLGKPGVSVFERDYAIVDHYKKEYGEICNYAVYLNNKKVLQHRFTVSKGFMSCNYMCKRR